MSLKNSQICFSLDLDVNLIERKNTLDAIYSVGIVAIRNTGGSFHQCGRISFSVQESQYSDVNELRALSDTLPISDKISINDENISAFKAREKVQNFLHRHAHLNHGIEIFSSCPTYGYLMALKKILGHHDTIKNLKCISSYIIATVRALTGYQPCESELLQRFCIRLSPTPHALADATDWATIFCHFKNNTNEFQSYLREMREKQSQHCWPRQSFDCPAS